MTAHIDALNRRDNPAIAATLHFPHLRLSGTTLKIWEDEASYLADFLARAGDVLAPLRIRRYENSSRIARQGAS